ncbi:hypothetical protein [Streptomyces sp. NPDC003032]
MPEAVVEAHASDQPGRIAVIHLHGKRKSRIRYGELALNGPAMAVAVLGCLLVGVRRRLRRRYAFGR